MNQACFLHSESLAFTDYFKAYRINSLDDQISLLNDLDRLTNWCTEDNHNLNVNKCCHISFFKDNKTFNTSYLLNNSYICL